MSEPAASGAGQWRVRIAWPIATWFGCGLVPKAPGTAGTLGAIPLYLIVLKGGRPGVLLAAIAVTLVGVWAASVVAHDLGQKDPQRVVVDEVAGFLTTMLPMPSASWRTVLIGVCVFRLLDIVKPWPVRSLERLPGGWGIVLDDVAAGVIGAGVMGGLQWLGVFTAR
jgi:phosphatidylglycerophosphatase A